MTPAWRRYARFWGARVDADVDDEMRFHMEMLIREYESRGMSPNDARAAAAQRLGDLPGARDACLTIGHRRQRRMARARMIDAFVQDVRYAMRTLGRQKGWTTVALLTLALGIGASTAMFSVVNSLVLHPLSYVGADRVRLAWLADEKSHVMLGPDAEIKDAWRSAHSLDALEDYDTAPLTLTGRGEPRSIQVGWINSSFLKLADAPIIRGRSFASEEERHAGGQVAILSEGFWRNEFGASPSTIGQRVTVDGKVLTIIGVVSSKMRLPNHAKRADLWMPMGHDTTGMLGAAVVRLRPGVTARDAERELDLIGARLGRTTLIEHSTSKRSSLNPATSLDFANR